jgi:hypothetical protein
MLARNYVITIGSEDLQEPERDTMLARFSVRFVIAVLGGAVVGLLVGVVGTYVFGQDWNVFAVMPWGIMAGAIGLAFAHTLQAENAEKAEPEQRADADGS